MADANRRIKLFRLIKPSHTAFRAARGKRTKSCRGKQVGHTKKEDKPPLFLCHFLKSCKDLLKCCIVVMGIVV